MAELMQENVIFLVLALVVGLLVAWWVFAATRRTRVEIESRDAADEPARRNQALIDSPPAAEVPPATPPGLAGAGAAVAAAAPMVPAEAPPEAPAEAPPAPPAQDDELTRIKGLGPKLAQQLRELGVTSLAQIAAWDDAEIERIDAQLGRFKGRIRRDDWRTQAALLAAGDTAAYQAKFGKL